MPENPRGWRRLWPTKMWLQTVEYESRPGVWQWRIWSEDKTQLLACGAEDYSRQADAARGGVRFGEMERKALEELGGRA